MSAVWYLLALVLSLVLALVGSRRALREPDLVRPNYAGELVPVVLGGVLVRAANSALALALLLALLAGPVPAWPVPAAVLAGTLVLLLAGRLDDRSSREQRGLAGHLRALFAGQPTTGILKLIAGMAISLLVGALLEDGLLRVAVATLVVALAINVTNAMDVRPGRALKWTGLWLLPISLLALSSRLETGTSLAYGAYLGAGFGVLYLDLGRKGMLGDEGSNPLGLVLGTALAGFLPFPLVVVALLLLLGLQVAAETVTISRLIEAVPPLRWFERLGRRN